MYIENIKIGNFGKLSHREIVLSSGVNVIEGNNESGKTTLSEFIKFIFYGLSNKTADGEMSERKRYISWNNSSVSGSIVLNTEKGRYRIERSMSPHGAGYKDILTVVDLSSNSVISGIKNAGEYFFGIPEEVFTKTVYIRQGEGAYFNGETIGQAVENIFYSADESVNTDKALKKLDDARVGIKHKKNTGRGLLVQLEQERDGLISCLSDARMANEQILSIESSIRHSEQTIEKNKRDCEIMTRQLRKAELYALLKKIDEKKAYEQKHCKYKEGKNEVVEKMSHNGFFPDKAYFDELEKERNELTYLKKDVDRYDEEKEFVPFAEYSEDTAQRIRQYGGKNGIKELLSSLSWKNRTFTICSLIFLVGFIGALALGFFVSKALLFVSVAFASASVFCLCLSFVNKNRLNELFSEFSASDSNSLLSVVEQTEQAEKDEIRTRELMLYKEKNRQEAVNKLNGYINVISDTLGRWGRALEEKSYMSALSGIDNALSDIKEIDECIAQYDSEISKLQAVISHIKAETDSYDEYALRSEFESITEHVEYEKIDEIKRRYDFTVKALDSLRLKVGELEKTLASLKAITDRPSELETRLNAVNDSIKDLTHKHDAYVLAYEKLEEAGISLRGKLAPRLSEVSGKYMSGLTDGKYSDIGVSDRLQMTYSFEEDGTDYTKEVAVLSSGTQDVAYVSLRLALADLFCKSGERLPVIFDEAFARLDDGRLKNMLSVAHRYSEKRSQSIILTSQTREAVFAKNVCGENYTHTFM